MFGVDTLLSLPLVSVLLLPSLTSYSTSLNVLFFYLTWSTLLLSHSQLKVEFLGTLFIRAIFYLLPSYFFLLFDASVPSVAINVKEHGDVGIATSAEHGGVGRKGSWWKVAMISTANVVLSVAIQTGVEWLLTSVLHVRSALKISTSLPLPWAIIKDVARGFLMRELLTYVLHRYTLHTSRSPLKTLHAKWYHSLPSTYSMMAHYDHPLPYLLRVFLPTYLPAAFFRFHLLTYHAFLALISLEELFVHSGYSVLPSGFVLGGMARRQEKHLMGGAKGNYSAYGLADLLAGTSVGSDLLEDVEDEAEKKDVAGKSKRAGRKAKSKGGRIARQLRDRYEDDE